MMQKEQRQYFKNEQGQALVFVIATMAIALSVGIGVSLRNLASISRTSRSDTFTRAQAAAEGGAENMLSRTDEELSSLVSSGITETIEFTPSAQDNVVVTADVTVAPYTLAAGENYLVLEIEKNGVSEMVLDGNPVTVCWVSSEANVGSDLSFVAYNASDDISRSAVKGSDRDGFPEDYSSSFPSADGGRDIFTDCYTPSLPGNSVGLRIRSINASSTVGVYPANGTLPNQGYRITSIGKLRDVEQGENAEVVVKVVKSFPYLSGIFDFGVFSGSDSDTLN